MKFTHSKMLPTLCVLSVFGGLTNAVAQTSVSVTTQQDSFVHEQDSVNHGNRTTIMIKRDDNHDRIAFLEFNLSAYAGKTISAASLSVVMDSVTAIGSVAAYNGSAMTLDVHGLAPAAYGSGWSESAITGNSRPGRSSQASTSNNINFTEGSLWMPEGTAWNAGRPAPLGSANLTLGASTELTLYQESLALLEFLNMAKEYNDGLVTLVLWTSTEHDETWMSIASKEHGTLAGPALNLTIVPEPATYALLAAVASLALVALRRRHCR